MILINDIGKYCYIILFCQETAPASELKYFIIHDIALKYLLYDYIQKPFSQIGLTVKRRIYNYRLSRARIVENAFGILANRFRVLTSPINLATYQVYPDHWRNESKSQCFKDLKR